MNSSSRSQLQLEQKELEKRIFGPFENYSFEETALQAFRIQSQLCEPYSRYISLLGIDPLSVKKIDQIPFLPVTFFKTENIVSFEGEPQKIFTSSATTGMTPAKHLVKELSIYEKSFFYSFEMFLGDLAQYNILALLPSYLEREGSSLVYMAESLIKSSQNSHSGFYIYNFEQLHQTLQELREIQSVKKEKNKTILLGVTFALLDFAQQYPIEFPSLTVIETGGMKGRKKELSREEVHQLLTKGFGVSKIGSEYGMAELLSQAWSLGDGVFETPPWMQIIIRDLNNPFKQEVEGQKGGINIIDLANIYSCSFIETEDMGVKKARNTFSVSGRIQNSELRGCNLLLEN